MSDPPLDGHSIGHTEDYCPGINVHLSSGVFNKAFYLLTNTEGWNIWKAFDVFLTANRSVRQYFTVLSHFFDFIPVVDIQVTAQTIQFGSPMVLTLFHKLNEGNEKSPKLNTCM